MVHDYYIVTGQDRKGPYDLVMLVKKIRNGSIIADTIIGQTDPDTVKPASQWPELTDFIDEMAEEKTTESLKTRTTLQQRTLVYALQSGWRFLQRNLVSTVFAGIWVLAAILMIGVTNIVKQDIAREVAYVICFVFSHFLLSCYMFLILRMTRGQPISLVYLISKIAPSFKGLLFSSACISITAIVGLVISTEAASFRDAMIGVMVVVIPGFFILTLFVFTPLIMLDQGYGCLKAMKMSFKAVIQSGMENMGVLYALFVINFIAGLVIILPMAITLPITMSTLAEIYDESSF